MGNLRNEPDLVLDFFGSSPESNYCNQRSIALMETLLWCSAQSPMDTSLVALDTRDVLRCDFCKLIQYRTRDSHCRRCHRPLEAEESEAATAVAIPSGESMAPDEAGLKVAAQVREIRRARHLSQRQLAGRMQVPRTYISKIENGKAVPTLSSLERLAGALGVEVGQLVRDARSQRDDEVSSILADPLLAEIADLLPALDSLHRTLLVGAARDMSMGRRRTA